MMTTRATILVPVDGYVKQTELDLALKTALRQAQFSEIGELEDRVLRFDFTEATWFDLSALLWLIPVLSRLRRQANVVEVRMPSRPASEESIRRARGAQRLAMQSAENLWSALLRWDFFEVLSRCVDDPLNLLPPDQHAALLRPSRYSRSDRSERESSGDAGEVANTSGRLIELSVMELGNKGEQSINEAVSEYNSDLVRNNLRYHMRWSEREIDDFTTIAVPHAIQNVSHAKGSFAIVASRADEKFLHFCVTDNGMGIPNLLRGALRDHVVDGRRDSALIEYFAGAELLDETLREVREARYTDSEFVVASTVDGVGSDAARPGFGLFYLKRLVLDEGGELRIRSGRAMVTFDARSTRKRAAAPVRADDLLESPGTSMRIMLPRSSEAVAAKEGR